jgi:hypothetical protein
MEAKTTKAATEVTLTKRQVLDIFNAISGILQSSFKDIQQSRVVSRMFSELFIVTRDLYEENRKWIEAQTIEFGDYDEAEKKYVLNQKSRHYEDYLKASDKELKKTLKVKVNNKLSYAKLEEAKVNMEPFFLVILDPFIEYPADDENDK